MRVGEIILAKTKTGGSLIQVHQLTQLVDEKQCVVALKLTFLDFQHNYNQHPFCLVINRRDQFCPVQIMSDNLSLRGYRPGPRFLLVNGSPVSRTAFIEKLFTAIKYCGLDPSR